VSPPAPPPPRSQLPGSRSAGYLRLAVYFGVLGGVLSCLGLRAAYAQGERAVFRLGQRLLSELGPALVGPAQALTINGQSLLVASKQTELSVPEVLDRFAASCDGQASPDGVLALPPELAKSAAPGPSAGSNAAAKRAQLFDTVLQHPTRFGVLRHDSAEEGHLACLAQPGARRGLEGLLNGAREFVASGDLSRMGDVRYVAARKLASGKTHVIAVWSEGSFRVNALFPETGDAPGTDVPGIARPAQARRELCATVPGGSYGVRLYTSPQPPHDVMAFYDQTLPRSGWQALPLRLTPQQQPADALLRAFTRNGQAVAISTGRAQDKTTISLVDLGAVRQSAWVASKSLLH
jgi:hypothetical protein